MTFTVVYLAVQWNAFATETNRAPSSVPPSNLKVSQEVKSETLELDKKMATPQHPSNRTPPNPRMAQEKTVYGVPFRR